jgi:hypothetical protein
MTFVWISLFRTGEGMQGRYISGGRPPCRPRTAPPVERLETVRTEVADGAELERRLKEAAGDLAVLGPNCYGVLNLVERTALWPDEHGASPVERGVALITQSGISASR